MNVASYWWVPLGIAGLAVTELQELRPPVVSSSPPVIQMQPHDHAGPSGDMPTPPQQTMTIWRAGAATCGGLPVALVHAPNPLPALSWGKPSETVLRVAFRIAADGRPLTIRPEAVIAGSTADVLPALAASRFIPGAARSNCVIVFTSEQLPLDRVPTDLAMAYTVFPTGPRVPEALWRRIRPADASCYRPAPALLNRAYPDFSAIRGEQGRPLWSMVGYDIAARGEPAHVRTINGSRSAELDAASRRAVKQSRFGKGARRGCLYPYWKIADAMPAPEPPARESLPTQSEACKALGDWVREPRLVYPNNYRRRGIEGWAIVFYDVAPWGSVGNVKVVAAEPTSDFGEAATRMFTGLSRKSSGTGASMCMERIRYIMGKPGTPLPTDVGLQPLY